MINNLEKILPKKVINHLYLININSLDDLIKSDCVEVFLLLKKSGLTITKSILLKLYSIQNNKLVKDISINEKNILLEKLKNHHVVDIFPSVGIMEKNMQLALLEAKKAIDNNEIPIGAIVVDGNNKVIASSFNQNISSNKTIAHAEILAISKANLYLKNNILSNCDLYVTLEPCLMCAGAIINSRIRRLIYASKNIKFGVDGSIINIFSNIKLNHHTSVMKNICQKETEKLLKEYFQKLR